MSTTGLKEIRRAPGRRGFVAAPREARLPSFLGMAPEAPARLGDLGVAIVGTGSVGSNVALHLARLQVGALTLVDRGQLKAESVLTHLAITPADVGKPKASTVGRLCKWISPTTRVLAHDGPVADLDLLAFADADVVVVATDNILAEIEIGAICVRLGKPFVQGSVYGDMLIAHARFLANRDGEGPCPVCGFSAAEWDHVNRATTFSCEGLAAGRPAAQVAGQPTMSTSFLCSVAADLVMVQILRYFLGLGRPVDDTMVEYCGFTNRTVTTPLTRNPRCPCEHILYQQVATQRPVARLSLRELAAAAGLGGCTGDEALAFAVDGLVFAELGACGCEGSRPIRRFVAAGGEAGRCQSCGGAVRAQPFYCHQPVPGSVVADVLDVPLRELGAGSARSVVVRGDAAGVLLRHRGAGAAGGVTNQGGRRGKEQGT